MRVRIGLVLTVSAIVATPAGAATPALHPAGATLRGQGGAVMRVDVRLPLGYRIVLHDPARLHGGGLEFEIRRGRAQYGVVTLVPGQLAGVTGTPDPAYPTPRQTPAAVARSYRRVYNGALLRLAPGRYLLLRDALPVGLVVPLAGAVPTIVVGTGSGRTLLEAVARTMVARLVAPRPLAPRSDPAALALRDRANRAISAQDAYSFTEGPPSIGGGTFDIIRSARYLARFGDATRTFLGALTIGRTEYTLASSRECWSAIRSFDPNQFLAPRLPIAATGLSYRPVVHVDGLLRLRYRYWTAGAAPLTGRVDLDPATLLPVRSETAIPLGARSFTFPRSWTWAPVTRHPVPHLC